MESKKSNSIKFILKNILYAFILVFAVAYGTLLWLDIYSHHGDYIEVPDYSDMTIDELSKNINEKNLRYRIIDSLYIPNKKRGVVINQNPQPGFFVKQNRKIFITINAIKPQIIKMPNLIGLSMRKAKSDAERHGLIIKELIYEEDIATNYVLDQLYDKSSIEPNVKIIKGSSISLVCGISPDKRTTNIPDLFNRSTKQAINNIHNSSLNIGKTTYDNTIKTSKDSLLAKVWKQYPAFGTKRQLTLGSKINIWLTKDTEILDRISEIREAEKQRLAAEKLQQEAEQKQLESTNETNINEN